MSTSDLFLVYKKSYNVYSDRKKKNQNENRFVEIKGIK